MKQLFINQRFAKCFSSLEPEQLKRLEGSLKTDLTTEPVIYWNQTSEILDGHHRYAIAQRLDIELETHGKDFDSEDDALLWIIRNQTTKRNLDNRSQVLREAVALEIKIEGKSKSDAVELVAAQQGVSEATVWRAEAEPKAVIAQFKQSRKDLEAAIYRKKEQAAKELQAQAKAEKWDEGTLEDKWYDIEANLQDEIENLPEFVEVQEQGETVQELIAESPHLKRELSDKRGTKKSVAARREKSGKLKRALTAIDKALTALDDVTGIVPTTDAKNILIGVKEALLTEQAADKKAAQKRKFGGK